MSVSRNNTPSTRNMKKNSASTNALRLRLAGAGVIAATAYLAYKSGLTSPTIGVTEKLQTKPDSTVKLSMCPVATPTAAAANKGGKAKKGAKKTYSGSEGGKSVDDLVADHAALGFATGDLLENVARPMQEKWAAQQATKKPRAPCFSAPKTFVADLKAATNETLNALGYTVADSFSRPVWSKGVAHGAKTVISNAANTVKAAVVSTHTLTHNLGVNTTATAACIKDTVKDDVQTVLDAVSRKQQHELRHEFSALMGGKTKDGRLATAGLYRSGLDDAVAKVQIIYSHCEDKLAKTTENKAVATKFGGDAAVMEVFNGKGRVYKTIVADGWGFEARVAEETVARSTKLWTNVVLSKGGFELELKRDKVGLVHASVNGMSMGEI